MPADVEFTLTEAIHESELTTTYRGYRDADRLPVAIKRLKNGRPTPTQIAKLRYEYVIARDLAAPGIVRVYGVEKVDGNMALVMEDARGPTLSEVISSRKLSIIEALRVAIAIASAVEVVHRGGVIHMDVKPQNIIVDTGALAITLTDFGSSTRLSQETQRPRSAASLKGTLAYMSPEQTGRMNRFIDRRTDLYSLGVTLYELFTGLLPFRTKDFVDLVHSHIATVPPSPREIAKEIPEAISSIIMRLLAKVADDRYQSASGLKADLAECLSQMRSSGHIEPFPLGRDDYVDELRIPQKLYGREDEVAALLSAWERASRGPIELLLVAGYSGIGKSVLVNEIHTSIASGRGRFVGGKFDQLNRSIPYAAVAQVFQELIRNILTEPAEAIEAWRAKLARSLGSNGQIIIDIIPDVELIIGRQPPVPALEPTESQSRFNLALQDFCRTFAAEESPLVIFLDDLQWADPASLKFLQVLVTESSIRHMLVLGAYRDNEVDESHIFSSVLAELKKSSGVVATITLKPLRFSTVNQIIADTLSCGKARSEPLAKIIFEKTQGNPFFMHQFLRTLDSEGLLSFDAASHSWAWDIGRIQAMNVTDNVVDFMAKNLRKLSASTQRVLTLASCIGHRFDLMTLSRINRKSPRETARELWEALREGLVMPIEAESRLLDVAVDSDMEGGEAGSSLAESVSYDFLHDRVQQAASTLIDDAQRREVHLQIGRLMLAARGGDQPEGDLFEIVGHMNQGASLITDQAEQDRLSRLNFNAGLKAKAGLAYEGAAGYFRAGAALQGEEGWERRYELMFALGTELAECEYLSGHFNQANATFDDLSSRVRDDLDRAHLLSLRVIFNFSFAKYTEAMDYGIQALRLLGVAIPAAPEESEATLRAAVAELSANLGDRQVATLIDLPVASEPKMKLAQKLLANLAGAAASTGSNVGTLAALTQINLSIKHGTSDTTAAACMTYAMLLMSDIPGYGGGAEPYRDGYEFAKLGIELNRKFNSTSSACRLLVLFGCILHFFEPLRSTVGVFLRARQAGFESGDLAFLSYSCTHVISAKLGLGDELSLVDEEIDQNLELMKRTNEQMTTLLLTAAKQVVANLRGRTTSHHTWSDGSFDEQAFVQVCESPENIIVLSYYYASKAQLSYIYGDYDAARSFMDLAEKTTIGWSSLFWATEITFYRALLLAALYAAAPEAEREGHMAALAPYKAKLARWAALGSTNYEHKLTLVEAEIARVTGEEREAMELYDQAIKAAHEHGFVRDEAMANELCAKFYLSIGRTRCASAYMTDAHQGYLAWGATAKVDDLKHKVPHLVPQAATLPPARNMQSSPSSPSNRNGAGQSPTISTSSQSTSANMKTDLLDVEAVIRAAQTIAGEVDLDKVVSRLMDITIKNAGAQKGVFILERDGRLMIEAIITAHPSDIKIGPATPVESSAELPLTIAHYVARTKEPVMLGDAASEPRFAADPYVAERRLRSVLCLAMVHQGRATGIFYLENNLVNDAFTAARLKLLKLLLMQAGTAVENALLYARLNRHTKAQHEAEEALKIEYAERERSEQARVKLQEEIIRVQNVRLAELSTPIIPITDQIVVMPLIGVMDRERAQQALTTALLGVQANRAEVVIIDITGVKLVDSDVASTLMSTARALRMLGAQAVLTGIRPEVSQTLAGLEIDFSEIVTRGTLQSGIAYALRLTGGSELFRSKARR